MLFFSGAWQTATGSESGNWNGPAGQASEKVRKARKVRTVRKSKILFSLQIFLKNFKFFRGYRAEDLGYENDRVSGVKISNLDEDIFLSGKVVSGFDGRNSMVRRKLAFSVEKFHQPADVLWFKVPYPEYFIPGSQAFFSLFPMSMLVCVPVYDHKMQVGWLIPSGSYGELKQQGKEKWIEFIRENSPKDFSDHLKDCLDKNEISDPFVLKMTLDRVKKWNKSCLLYTSDAADE